ncbi:hypothetical protein PCASD_14401 [Puccinia coronata f. sp. avenae]|uniref:ADP-ribosylation factor-like protein 1 n=1 Tax=Puccinia coronata f. sp. avenae TaxID=200324 RepID=A0A2N5U6V1_9BASI|nr:hypothetical protein PCASD_14401 [Puccinia coronata f. sp. avenae]
MGIAFSSVFGRISSLFSRQSEVRILMLGLDSAGKTTILYRIQIGEVVSTIPTIGFNVETVQYKNIKFQVWDLGGQTSIRPYWRCYYANTQAVIYVVDSNDRDRLPIAKAELLAMLSEDELKDARLLVFANKQDQPNALTPAEVSEGLGLDTLKNRQWSIFKACAIKGWSPRCKTMRHDRHPRIDMAYHTLLIRPHASSLPCIFAIISRERTDQPHPQ